MLDVRHNRFPGGKLKALTLSYDDGRGQDRRLVNIMNQHGLKGAFHLNSGFFGRDNYVEANEIAVLYAGHEISAHTVTHPHLDDVPQERIVMELMNNRASLETLAGYPVRGMSYPFGTWDERVVQALPHVGIEYARTTRSTRSFQMPDNFLLWHPTCHHKQMLELGEAFINLQPRYPRLHLLYVWGHSYEFDNDNNWETMEQFGELVGHRDDIWYAANSEIVTYVNALKQLRYGAAGDIVFNPSACPVWVSVQGKPVEIMGGETVQLRS